MHDLLVGVWSKIPHEPVAALGQVGVSRQRSGPAHQVHYVVARGHEVSGQIGSMLSWKQQHVDRCHGFQRSNCHAVDVFISDPGRLVTTGDGTQDAGHDSMLAYTTGT